MCFRWRFELKSKSNSELSLRSGLVLMESWRSPLISSCWNSYGDSSGLEGALEMFKISGDMWLFSSSSLFSGNSLLSEIWIWLFALGIMEGLLKMWFVCSSIWDFGAKYNERNYYTQLLFRRWWKLSLAIISKFTIIKLTFEEQYLNFDLNIILKSIDV